MTGAENAVGPERLDGDGADNGAGGGTDVAAVDRGRDHRPTLVGVLAEQTRQASALIEAMRDLVGDDDDIIATAVEGETNLHEAIGAAMNRYVELGALIASTGELIETVKDRQDRFKRQQTTLKEAIAVAMEGAEIKKLELPIATLSLRRVPPALTLTDEWLVPEKFWKAQDPKLDRRAVTDALKAGEIVPGAALDNGGVTLSVRQA